MNTKSGLSSQERGRQKRVNRQAMTALTKYQKLEGSGLWRADPQEQRRDVVVALGNSSLVITDARSGAVLSHWSLPTVHRINPACRPALYAPGPEEAETLEIDDETMIEALNTIRSALTSRPPWLRLRRGLSALALALVAGLAVFWLPGAMVHHTAGIVPPAKRAQIGREALEAAATGSQGVRVCADAPGRQALTTLRGRVLGASDRVAVVDGAPGLLSAHLPGHLVVIGRGLLERLDSPEALAGYLIGETLLAEAEDPLRDLLRFAGMRATFALLTTGNLPAEAVAGYAALRLARPMALPDAAALAARLDALTVSPSAYALSLPEHATALAQALADQPGAGARGATRLLSDGEWITLQNICQN